MTDHGPLTLREFQALMSATDRHGHRLDQVEDLAAKHEVELHGERGVFSALTDMTNQLRWTQRALWAIAASIIVAVLVQVLQGTGHA